MKLKILLLLIIQIFVSRLGFTQIDKVLVWDDNLHFVKEIKENDSIAIAKAINLLPCRKEYYIYYGKEITNPKKYKFPYPLNEMRGFYFSTYELLVKSMTDTNVIFYDSLPAGKWEKYKCIDNQIKISALKTISNFALNGINLSYYENGILKDSSYYKNDKNIGFSKAFYRNGNPLRISYYVENRWNPLYTIGFWENGIVSFYIDDITLFQTDFFESGEIKFSGAIDYFGNRQGEWMLFNKNGNLTEIVTFKDHQEIKRHKIR